MDLRSSNLLGSFAGKFILAWDAGSKGRISTDSILSLIPDVSSFLTQAEIEALLPDVSDFLTQAEIEALLPSALSRVETYSYIGNATYPRLLSTSLPIVPVFFAAIRHEYPSLLVGAGNPLNIFKIGEAAFSFLNSGSATLDPYGLTLNNSDAAALNGGSFDYDIIFVG